MTTESTKIVLKGPENWTPWHNQCIKLAKDYKILKLIEPGNPQLGDYLEEPPATPNLKDYDKLKVPQAVRRLRGSSTTAETPAQSSSSAQTAEGTETPSSQLEEIEAGIAPNSTKEMTIASRTAYQLDAADLHVRYSRYIEQDKRLVDFAKWITESVTPHLFESTCDPRKPLYEWYQALIDRAEDTNVDAEDRAHRAYQEACQPLTSMPKDFQK